MKKINSIKALVAALVNPQTSTPAIATVWAASHYSLVPAFAQDLNLALDEARKAGAFSAPVAKGVVRVQARLVRKAESEFDLWKQVRSSLNWAKCATFFEKGASPLRLPLMTEASARKAWAIDFGRAKFPKGILPLIAKGFAPTFEPKNKRTQEPAIDKIVILARKYYPGVQRNVLSATGLRRVDGTWEFVKSMTACAMSLNSAQDGAKILLEAAEVPPDMSVAFVGTRLWAEEAAKRANRPLVWLDESFGKFLPTIFSIMDETIDPSCGTIVGDPPDDGSDDWIDPAILETLESVEADYDADLIDPDILEQIENAREDAIPAGVPDHDTDPYDPWAE